MKLKRRTEYDKIYYDMPQKVRVAIPLESYNQLKKMVYRNLQTENVILNYRIE